MTKIIKPIHTRHVRAPGRCTRADHRPAPLPASIISPTMIGQPIMTAILAVPLLGEIPTTLQFAGGVIALTGIYLVNVAHNRTKQIPNELQKGL